MDPVTSWMDGYLDPASGLLLYPSRRPGGSPLERAGVHRVRESAWYALGLLERGSQTDRERAERVLSAVLEQQVDAPGSVAHGTWPRTTEEPHPTARPEPLREWVDYDPNWREFVGTTLVVALARHESRLAPALVARLDQALERAGQGSFERGVAASYTNIALMSAFLLDWLGDRLGKGAWRRTGVALGRAVRSDYDREGAFGEHNSPTYYGTDLVALALWRDLARDPWLRQAGGRFEADLWSDLARYWHAGLGNLCGPYTRAYGMDCRDYVAGLAMCVEAGVAGPGGGGRRAALPPLGHEMQHAHDRCKGPLLTALPPRIPAAAAPHFEAFQGERTVAQCISRESFERHASAWLAEGVMLGGEDASGRHIHHQHHPATAHWLEGTPRAGRVGWLRVRTPAPVRAWASPGLLEVEILTGVDWLREAEVPVECTLRTGAALRSGGFRTSGLEFRIGGSAIDAAGFAPQPGNEWVSRRLLAVGAKPDRLRLEFHVA